MNPKDYFLWCGPMTLSICEQLKFLCVKFYPWTMFFVLLVLYFNVGVYLKVLLHPCYQNFVYFPKISIFLLTIHFFSSSFFLSTSFPFPLPQNLFPLFFSSTFLVEVAPRQKLSISFKMLLVGIRCATPPRGVSHPTESGNHLVIYLHIHHHFEWGLQTKFTIHLVVYAKLTSIITLKFTNKVHNSPCSLCQVNGHKWEHFQNVRLGLATTLYTLVGYLSMVNVYPTIFHFWHHFFNTQLVFPLGLLGWGPQGMGEWPLILGTVKKIKSKNLQGFMEGRIASFVHERTSKRTGGSE